jgi:DoxX-like family
MNIVLWVLQSALAWLCIAGGYFQIFKIEELQKGVAAMRELPQGLWVFLGAFGCLAGVTLILPGAIRVLPVLVPIAAVAVCAQSLLISGFYVYYGDRSPLTYSVAMALVAAFVAYGRFVLSPFGE